MYDSRIVKIAAAVGVLALTLGVQGCPRETVGWTYGGRGYEVAYAVQETSDGNYVVAGYSDSYDYYSSGARLLKVDPTGAELWSRAYAELDATDIARDVPETSDGGFVLAGTRYSYSEWNSKMFLAKTDASGELLWRRTFPETEDYESDACAAQVTSDGGLVVAGSVRGEIPAKGDYYHFQDMYLVKTDPDGNLLWSQQYSAGNGADTAQAVQETSDGGFIVAGSTYSVFGGYREQMYLVRTDEDGNVLWERTFAEGEEYPALAYGVQETADGGFVVAGYSNNSLCLMTDVVTYAPATYVVKTDADGNVLWERTYDEPGIETEIYALVETIDGGLVLAGERSTDCMSFPKMYLAKIDADGELLWERTYLHADRRFSRGNDVQETSDGGFIVAGETRRGILTFDKDMYLLRTDADGNVVSGNP